MHYFVLLPDTMVLSVQIDYYLINLHWMPKNDAIRLNRNAEMSIKQEKPN